MCKDIDKAPARGAQPPGPDVSSGFLVPALVARRHGRWISPYGFCCGNYLAAEKVDDVQWCLLQVGPESHAEKLVGFRMTEGSDMPHGGKHHRRVARVAGGVQPQQDRVRVGGMGFLSELQRE